MAHTTTNSRPRRGVRHVGITLALVVGALVIPSAANGAADSPSDGYTSPDVFLGNAGGDSEDLSSSGYRTPDVVLGGSIGPSQGDSSDDPVTGAPGLVSGLSTDDGFDWASAAIGAGAVMTLVALGGAALLTVRRRTAVASSAA